MINKIMSFLNIFMTIFTILSQVAFGFIPQRIPINLPVVEPEAISQQSNELLRSSSSLDGTQFNDGGRYNVYDPGEIDLSESDNNDNIINEPVEISNVPLLEDEIQEEHEIAAKSEILLKMLKDPNISTLPVVYVEESDLKENDNDSNLAMDVQKRSRYYRRYPWKRYSRNRPHYEPDAIYLCVPSREDIFKLLVGIHENRNGNHHKTVNFCNRKRPAKAIFTNIRFLG